jgi:hypothetical protein
MPSQLMKRAGLGWAPPSAGKLMILETCAQDTARQSAYAMGRAGQRTFITMKVRSSYCSASRIQFFISAEIRALISSAGR